MYFLVYFLVLCLFFGNSEEKCKSDTTLSFTATHCNLDGNTVFGYYSFDLVTQKIVIQKLITLIKDCDGVTTQKLVYRERNDYVYYTYGHSNKNYLMDFNVKSYDYDICDQYIFKPSNDVHVYGFGASAFDNNINMLTGIGFDTSSGYNYMEMDVGGGIRVLKSDIFGGYWNSAFFVPQKHEFFVYSGSKNGSDLLVIDSYTGEFKNKFPAGDYFAASYDKKCNYSECDVLAINFNENGEESRYFARMDLGNGKILPYQKIQPSIYVYGTTPADFSSSECDGLYTTIRYDSTDDVIYLWVIDRETGEDVLLSDLPGFKDQINFDSDIRKLTFLSIQFEEENEKN